MRVFIDGASFPYQAYKGAAAFIVEREKEDREEISNLKKAWPLIKATNNQAEYLALIGALKWIAEHALNGDIVHIYSDSQIVVHQIAGDWDIRKLSLKHLNDQARAIASTLASSGISYSLEWVPRKKNLAGKLLEKSL